MSLPPADWDARYQGDDYLFGREPALFVGRLLPLLPARARILCLADGEGRNSVALAAAGHGVTAMEASGVALAKARALAAARGVQVDFRQAGIEAWDWTPGAFDVVAGIFIQFAPPGLRAQIHAGIARTLRPGGIVALHGYAPRQVTNGWHGGPRAVENLYTLPMLRADFPGWREWAAQDVDMEIHEGRGHVGRSALVDFVAEKPRLV